MSYNKTETRELNTPVLNEEELEVIEVLDHRALFSNGRIKPEQIPEGLHAYDLRHSDDVASAPLSRRLESITAAPC